MTDSDQTSDEIIFAVRFDGDSMRTFGGTTFIVHAAVGGNMDASQFGIGGGGAGHRVTPEFVSLFEGSEEAWADGRALFDPDGPTVAIVNIGEETDGGAGADWNEGYAAGV